METISRLVLTFLLNSLWQIALISLVAAGVCRLLRNGPARLQHAVWMTALAFAVLLPVTSAIPKTRLETRLQYQRSIAEVSAANPGNAPAATQQIARTPEIRTLTVAQVVAKVLLGCYGALLLFGLLRLAAALFGTLRIQRNARATVVPEAVDRVWQRCQAAFGVTAADLRFSADLAGPVSAGKTIILPDSLRTESSDAVLITAIGHEMAHIARHDFALRVVEELLRLPVRFHPASWFLAKRLEHTREMACDEMVAERLLDAGAYVRSIVTLASAMAAPVCPGLTLGVFDGDILEERIRRLLERPRMNLKRARLLLAGGLGALALSVVIASSVALTARAQSTAEPYIQQGLAAQQRGDYPEAARQFAAAVRLDPAHLGVKLYLAGALLAQALPAEDPNTNPAVAEARRQLLDVLERDPKNRGAISTLMTLAVHSRQFDQARDWALRSIQVDGSDKGAYYTLGFVDWNLCYPDYGAARQAAGMQPGDPGIIPDAALRASMRARHQTQIEEGLQNLQTAIQLDPGYSDAMAYANLLLRIEAGIVDDAARSAELISQADGWVQKALDAKRQQAVRGAGAPPAPAFTEFSVLPPPPPPPPPPPGNPALTGTIGGAQARLLTQTPAVYPALARQARISGAVRLEILIEKDGTVHNIKVVSGHPLLVPRAIEAVRQWRYEPPMVNGESAEVSTVVEVNFQ
jgi:TonB family protein